MFHDRFHDLELLLSVGHARAGAMHHSRAVVEGVTVWSGGENNAIDLLFRQQIRFLPDPIIPYALISIPNSKLPVSRSRFYIVKRK